MEWAIPHVYDLGGGIDAKASQIEGVCAGGSQDTIGWAECDYGPSVVDECRDGADTLHPVCEHGVTA